MSMFLKSLGLLALTLATFGTAQAVPLSALLNGDSITAGDKVFDQWQSVFFDSSDPTVALDLASIQVTALNDGGLDPGPGLAFDFGDQFSIAGDGIFAYLDFTFGFRVTPSAGLQIKDVVIELTETSIATATDQDFLDAGIYIEEKVGSAPGLDDLARQTVEFSALFDNQVTIDDPFASTAFTPQSEIFVTKNLLVWATDVNESATLSGLTQRFSQRTTVVPEPGTLGLLALGCVGLIRRLGRQRRCVS